MTSIFEKDYKYCPTCKEKLVRSSIDDRQLLNCKNCGFIFWNNPKPVVSILLYEGKKILMLQRANEPLKDYWCLPGGYINYDETPEEAIKREAKEEAGIEITIDNLVGAYRIDNDPRGVDIDIIFSGKSVGEINLNSESKDFKYFEIDKLPNKIAYKHREAISDWLKTQGRRLNE